MPRRVSPTGVGERKYRHFLREHVSRKKYRSARKRAREARALQRAANPIGFYAPQAHKNE